MSETDPEAPELCPPSAARVMGRALVLSALICRGFLEQDAGSPDADAFRGRVCTWLKDHDLWSELEPQEAELMTTPLGAADPRKVVDATWRSEGLAVLVWALRKAENLPSHDTAVDPKALTDAVGFLAEGLAPTPALREAAEIEAMGQRCFALHWRLREFSIMHASIDFVQLAKTAWFGPLDITGLPLVAGDLSVRGVPLLRADPREVKTCEGTARERHHAINWLLGYAQIYSDVDTST